MLPTAPPALPPWTGRRVALATLVVLSVLLAFYLLFRFYVVVFILFVAIVIGVAIRPLVEGLHQRGVSRGLGVILVYVVLLSLAVGFLLLLTPLLVDQVTTIVGKAPDYYTTLRDHLMTSPSVLIQRLAMQLPGTLTFTLSLGGAETPSVPSLGAVGQVFGYLLLAARTIFLGTAILVLAYYWTLDGERTLRSLLARTPTDRRNTFLEVISEMEQKVGAYVRGVVILSVVMAILACTSYLIIGLPYALVLGLIAGVFEALPVIGPVLGAAPPVLLALSLDPSKVIWVVVAVIVMQQAEGNLLVPRVMDQAVGVNAIVTILAITAFGSFFGLGGAIMAIPLAAVIQVLINRFVFSPASVQTELPERRDRHSLLRFEAQELVQDVRKLVRRKNEQVGSEPDQIEDEIEAIATDIDSILAQMELPEEKT